MASVMTVRLPADLKHRIEIVAKEQGVSINQLAMYMFAREVSLFEAGNKISEYWEGYNKEEIFEGFDSVMGKVKECNKVPKWDEIL
ncbi:toxin-antitoxin system HicB family antitoxin [Candidatus Halobeggiatoa sp. HSG11]|nr:toxin-antitoxin system HicB family antitoxin [Candidatus Halobeggiatoa sp. HSG11]